MATAPAIATCNMMHVPDTPHQPRPDLNFKFPKRNFGRKTVVHDHRSFQHACFKWRILIQCSALLV
jgi:hypothetical protein